MSWHIVLYFFYELFTRTTIALSFFCYHIWKRKKKLSSVCVLSILSQISAKPSAMIYPKIWVTEFWSFRKVSNYIRLKQLSEIIDRGKQCLLDPETKNLFFLTGRLTNLIKIEFDSHRRFRKCPKNLWIIFSFFGLLGHHALSFLETKTTEVFASCLLWLQY